LIWSCPLYGPPCRVRSEAFPQMAKPVNPGVTMDLPHHQTAKMTGEVRLQQRASNMRSTLVLFGLLVLVVAAQGCATRSQTLAEQQAVAESEDEITCREKSGADEAAYERCRKALAEERAQQAAVQEQRRREFDRVLGAGTDGMTSY
jgi:hypothetical protein